MARKKIRKKEEEEKKSCCICCDFEGLDCRSQKRENIYKVLYYYFNVHFFQNTFCLIFSILRICQYHISFFDNTCSFIITLFYKIMLMRGTNNWRHLSPQRVILWLAKLIVTGSFFFYHMKDILISLIHYHFWFSTSFKTTSTGNMMYLKLSYENENFLSACN